MILSLPSEAIDKLFTEVKMNKKELQATRRLLMISVKEAADHVGNVSARTWQRWEHGSLNVPGDIGEKMQNLAEKRRLIIARVKRLTSDAIPTYHMTYHKYKLCNSQLCVIDWRISQSVAAYFFIEAKARLD